MIKAIIQHDDRLLSASMCLCFAAVNIQILALQCKLLGWDHVFPLMHLIPPLVDSKKTKERRNPNRNHREVTRKKDVILVTEEGVVSKAILVAYDDIYKRIT